MIDLKPNEWASIITGITGLIFGGAAYLRALSAERRAARAEARALDNERKQLEVQFATERDLAQVEAHIVLSTSDRRLAKIRYAIIDAKNIVDPTVAETVFAVLSSVEAAEHKQRVDFESNNALAKALHGIEPSHEALLGVKRLRTTLKRNIADERFYEEQIDKVLAKPASK